MVIRPRGKRNLLYLRYYDSGRTVWKSLKTTDKRLADYRAARIIKDLREGRLPQGLRSHKTEDALKAFLEDSKARVRPLFHRRRSERLRMILACYKKPYLSHLNTERVSKTLDLLAAKKAWSAKTYNHYRGDLFSFFEYCYVRDWINSNPIKAIPPRKVSQNPVRYLNKKEIKTILKAAKADTSRPWLYPAIALGIFAGLRCSEIKALEWEDVDFRSKSIAVANKTNRLTKSGRFRVVPMSQGLAELLKPYKRKKGPLFETSQFQSALWKFRRDNKFPKEWNWLVFRHTFGTHHALAEGGKEKLLLIRDWMGHSNSQVTEKYYLGKESGYHASIEAFNPD